MLTIIAGTNRLQSKSRQFAEYYQSLLAARGTESRLLDLGELPDDFIRSALYENNGKNEVFNAYRDLVRGSERFVFIVPEYNGSFPGVLKAFLDGMGYPSEFEGKTAALVGISDGSMGGAVALSHLTDVLHYMGCTVSARRVRVPFMQTNFVDGRIRDARIEGLLRMQLDG